MPKNPKPVVIQTEEPKTLDVTIYDRTLVVYEPTTSALLDMADLGDLEEVAQVKGLFQFILDLLDEDDAAWLDERFHDKVRPITIGMLNRFVEAIMEAFIERLLASLRIIASAKANWEGFDGTCALRGLDPRRLPPDRFCNAFMVWAAERTDPKDWGAFKARIEKPPPRAPRTARSTEQEGAAFLSFLGAVEGG